MSDCNHDCSSCSSRCDGGIPKEKTNDLSHVKKVIGIVSGKGGVGKSLVTCWLSVLTRRMGYRVAVLDADITGPSVPKAFGLTERAAAMDEKLLLPVTTKTGIEVMSLNLLVEDESEPVVWRGPVLAGAVKQFWTDVVWGDVDYMYVDMPPGTGDVPLTVFQSLPLAGIVVVTTPQELVSMIVEKAVKMAGMLNVPVLGLVENLSYIECPDCGKRINVFGESHADQIAQKYGITTVARIPIKQDIATAVDHGLVELIESTALDTVVERITR